MKRISPGSQNLVPAGWVHLASSQLFLKPRAYRGVAIAVTVPAGAASGSYMTNVVASTYAPRAHGGTTLGAAAADKLLFTVRSESSFPWLIVGVVAGVLLIGLLSLITKRSGLRLSIRRT